MLKYLIAGLLGLTVAATEAQVRVVDSSPQSVRSGVTRQTETVDQKTEAYNQIQALQHEVSELRALVEEQGHQLSQLKQLQLDNYVDLDRRVSSLNNAKSKVDSESSAGDSSLSPVASGLSEADEYKAAYDLLRQNQVDHALAAFKEYLKKYPSGDFAGNSCYWLGEIHLLKNQLPLSRDWFVRVIEGFPDSNKVPDAKFKLGKVYHLLGDKNRAKATLTDAAAGSGDSARLAKQYLKENF